MPRLASSPPDPASPWGPDVDDRAVLLAEVDFKWLMAGQGLWIDSQRLHADPSYCAGLLMLALESRCAAVRECAAFLQTLTASSG